MDEKIRISRFPAYPPDEFVIKNCLDNCPFFNVTKAVLARMAGRDSTVSPAQYCTMPESNKNVGGYCWPKSIVVPPLTHPARGKVEIRNLYGAVKRGSYDKFLS